MLTDTDRTAALNSGFGKIPMSEKQSSGLYRQDAYQIECRYNDTGGFFGAVIVIAEGSDGKTRMLCRS
jgi:hypothetical protein